MTKKDFRHDMQRGLGSCVVALKTARNIEKFRPLVLWGCSRDMAYDAQCEGCRSSYLYELISQFPDRTPFIELIGKRLNHCMGSMGWEFMQDCELEAYFVSDGESQALESLLNCYADLFERLMRKRRRRKYGLLPERDNFESLCIILMRLYQDEKEQQIRQYQSIVRDLGELIQNNSLYSYSDFLWFQSVSEQELGEKNADKILRSLAGDKPVAAYVFSRDQYRRIEEKREAEKKNQELMTADEIYGRLKDGQTCPLLLAYRLMRQKRQEEVERLAMYYKTEEDMDVRCSLLRLLKNKICAWALDITSLIEDSQSENTVLAEAAFDALGYRRNEKVREYALSLLQSGKQNIEAVCMLAANYEDADKELLINSVKQIEITYDDGGWHQVFSSVMEVFAGSAKRKPRELLPYLYRNTLCSFCRERIVREMGRRRMLTKELLWELQYDCNEDIRKYALKKNK